MKASIGCKDSKALECGAPDPAVNQGNGVSQESGVAQKTWAWKLKDKSAQGIIGEYPIALHVSQDAAAKQNANVVNG